MVNESTAVEQVRRVSGAWWLLFVLGLLAVAAGVIVLVQPGISLTTLAVITGIFLLVDGVYEIVRSFSHSTENRGMWALLGVVSVIAGVLLVRHPIAGVTAIALLLGLWLLCFGLVGLVGAFSSDENGLLRIVVALVMTVAGIIIISSPAIAVSTLGLIVGIAFILRGIGLAVGAWALHGIHAEFPTTGSAAHST